MLIMCQNIEFEYSFDLAFAQFMPSRYTWALFGHKMVVFCIFLAILGVKILKKFKMKKINSFLSKSVVFSP